MKVDEHLLEALRHAPDREALPPGAVSAAILKAGRSAVARHGASVPPPAESSRRPLWPWFTGLGGALAAGLVAVWVWEAPQAPSAAPVVVAKNEPVAVPAAPAADSADSAVERTRETAVEPEADASSGGRLSAQPAAQAAAPAGGAAPAPALEPPPAPSPAAATAARRPATVDRLIARADEAAALRLNKPEQLRSRLVSEPELWQWQAPNTTAPQAVDAAALAWFERLLAASAQPWEPHVGPLPEGLTVPWLRQGKLEVELRLTDEGVLWRAAGGPALWQPMPPAALTDLTRRF